MIKKLTGMDAVYRYVEEYYKSIYTFSIDPVYLKQLTFAGGVSLAIKCYLFVMRDITISDHIPMKETHALCLVFQDSERLPFRYEEGGKAK